MGWRQVARKSIIGLITGFISIVIIEITLLIPSYIFNIPHERLAFEIRHISIFFFVGAAAGFVYQQPKLYRRVAIPGIVMLIYYLGIFLLRKLINGSSLQPLFDEMTAVETGLGYLVLIVSVFSIGYLTKNTLKRGLIAGLSALIGLIVANEIYGQILVHTPEGSLNSLQFQTIIVWPVLYYVLVGSIIWFFIGLSDELIENIKFLK